MNAPERVLKAVNHEEPDRVPAFESAFTNNTIIRHYDVNPLSITLKNIPKFPKPLPLEEQLRYLEKDDLNAILQNIKDLELQDFCLFSALTGLRISEILRLTWKDVDNPEGFLKISAKQKNRKEYRIPINKQTRELLARYKSRKVGRLFRFRSRHHPSKKFKEAARRQALMPGSMICVTLMVQT